MRAVFLPLLLAYVLADKPVIINNGAICENKATGFFVLDQTVLTMTDSIVYKDYSEDDCLKTCSQNRDQLGRSILCSSFVYHHESFTCTIYKDKKEPEGKAKAEFASGKRYFEKVCLNDAVPIHCADSQFLRVDNFELVGYAVAINVVETLEECLSYCSTNSTCKSALYFYEENECIFNTETALSRPEEFKRAQDDDKVIYFQNACAGVQIDPTTPATSKTDASSEREGSADETSGEKTTEFAHSSAETPEPKESTTEETAQEEEEHEPDHEVENEDSDDFVDKVDSDHEAASPAEDAEYEQDKEELEREEEELRKEREQIEKLAQKASYLKYKQHPRNFASPTLKASDDEENETSKGEHMASHQEDDQTEVEQLSKEEGDEPTEAQTTPAKKKPTKGKKEKKIESAEAMEEPNFTNYFSDWSDWTPCTKSGERQIRRRKCLDLRKCLGALMQVQNCPAVIPTTTGPIESVRSLISVPSVDYDGTEIRAPVSVVRPRPNSPLLPAGEVNTPAPEAVWSLWQGTCQQFASGQPCNDGQMIGFESRECVAKDPSYCEGPFFRYCTLAC